MKNKGYHGPQVILAAMKCQYFKQNRERSASVTQPVPTGSWKILLTGRQRQSGKLLVHFFNKVKLRMKAFYVLSPQRSPIIDLFIVAMVTGLKDLFMIDSKVQFSLVLMVVDAFGTANKDLAWQQVAIKPGTNMVVLAWSQNACAIFSNISDFAAYVCTMTHCMPSRRLQWLDKPLLISRSKQFKHSLGCDKWWPQGFQSVYPQKSWLFLRVCLTWDAIAQYWGINLYWWKEQ